MAHRRDGLLLGNLDSFRFDFGDEETPTGGEEGTSPLVVQSPNESPTDMRDITADDAQRLFSEALGMAANVFRLPPAMPTLSHALPLFQSSVQRFYSKAKTENKSRRDGKRARKG